MPGVVEQAAVPAGEAGAGLPPGAAALICPEFSGQRICD
jgi:hypothetical protein